MAKRSGADLLLQLLDEVRAMQKAQVEMQHALNGMGSGLNRAARLISAFAELTGKNEQRLEDHESRLRALELHSD